MEIAVCLQDSRITKSDLTTLKQCHYGEEIVTEVIMIRDQSIQNIICIKRVYYSGALLYRIYHN